MSRSLMTLLMILAAMLVAAGCGGEAADDNADSGTTVDAMESGDDAMDDGDEAMDEGDEGTEDGGGADIAAGKDLFVSTCGGCHTLDDAGTGGAVGPELSGGGYDAETVADAIANGQGAMPGGLLDGEDADNVAAYVADATS